MHACGHDCHISMLLTAVHMIHDIQDQLKGTVVFAFQPAEEIGRGAQSMIAEGALEGVDAWLRQHVWSDVAAGKVAMRKGAMMASGDRFKVKVIGKSGHGRTAGSSAVDAVVMGAAIVQNLQSLVSRELDPIDTAVVTVGKFTGGTRFNVIAGTAELEGTTRAFNPDVRNSFAERTPALPSRRLKPCAALQKWNTNISCRSPSMIRR